MSVIKETPIHSKAKSMFSIIKQKLKSPLLQNQGNNEFHVIAVQNKTLS